MKFYIQNIDTIDKCNLFVRALWSQLRVNGEKFAWNYFGHKAYNAKVFNLGILSCGNLKNNYDVIVGYKGKGIITFIEFSSMDKGDCDNNDKDFIKKSINLALKYENLMSEYNLKTTYRTPYLAIDNYKGERFIIQNTNEKDKFNITIKVSGFDTRDAKKQGTKLINYIVNFLSVCTNCVFYQTDKRDSDNVRNYNIYSAEKWIEGGNGGLSKKSCEFIEKILQEKLSEDQINFLNACYIYHYANKYYSMKFDFDKYEFSLVDLGVYNEEIMIVLYMSALEVIAYTENKDVDKCEKCGQQVYSIGKKVLHISQKYGDEYAYDKQIKDYYSKRSEFLHLGQVLSERTYSGSCNPEFEIKDGKFVLNEELPFVNIIFIKEYVGYILRNYFENTLN